MEKLLIIDGNSLINRAFYALPLLSNKDGEYSNAVYGFTNILLKAIQDHNPTHIAVAFDYGKKTFRNELYTEYKAKRKGTPPELISQFAILKKLLNAMNIKLFEKEGIEADDIIGCLSKAYDVKKIILTGDKDALQLISNNTEVWLTKKGISEIHLMNEQTLKEEMGLTPAQIIELKALMGDASDNIPGVSGVGEKTALSLLYEYGTLDEVYNNIDKIKGKLQEKLISDKQNAYLSKTLATIKCDVNINPDLSDLCYDYPFGQHVYDIFEQYNFNSLLKRPEIFKDNTQSKTMLKYSANVIEINNLEQIKNVLSHIKKAKVFNFELTNTFNFAFDKNCEYVVNITPTLIDKNVVLEELLFELKEVFEDEQIKKCLYDYKSLKHILYDKGINLLGVDFDCLLANYLIFAGDRSINKPSMIANFGLEEKFQAINLFYLKDEFVKKINEYNMTKLYYEIEFPLIDVLFDMEVVGFKIDIKVLDELSERYKLEIADLTKLIYTMAGEEFNINSPKQLAVVLFDNLKLSCWNNKKKSTGIEILEEIQNQHPVVPLIIRYRKIQKMSSTYLEAFRPLLSKDNIINTIFNQTLTVTGRLSSSEPNLQNIPVRTEEGKYLRRMFIPRQQGNLIVSADYSQIELRLLAHFSNDPNLLNAYILGKDIHTQTASEVFGVAFADVTSQMRRDAKSVNFGIIYGISDYGLSQNLGTTRKQAQDYIEAYFKKFPSVKAYMDNNVSIAKQQGYVASLLGRRRYISELKSANYMTRQFGERASMNMPLQGTASDIIKIAMVKVSKALKEQNLKSKLILQVHDELIIDADKSELNAVLQLLNKEMSGAVLLNVPLEVDINSGKNWFECK